jgi:hypothetical protein
LVAYVAGGGSVWLSVEDLDPCLPAAFVGASVGALAPAMLSSVTDQQTGAARSINASALSPVCVQSAGGAWYIKTGGDPTLTSGWDGGVADKCCRTDAGDCAWFGTQVACEVGLLTQSCLPCTSPSALGCPAWADGGTAPVQASVAAVSSLAANASALLVGATTTGENVTVALLTTFGSGSVVLSLTATPGVWSASPGLGMLDTLLTRMASDVSPLTVTAVNAASGASAPVQFSLNRQPG